MGFKILAWKCLSLLLFPTQLLQTQSCKFTSLFSTTPEGSVDTYLLKYVKLRADTICAPIWGHHADYKCQHVFKEFQKLAKNSKAAQPCMKLHAISCFHTWQITVGMPTCAGDIMEKKGRKQILKGIMSLQECLDLFEKEIFSDQGNGASNQKILERSYVIVNKPADDTFLRKSRSTSDKLQVASMSTSRKSVSEIETNAEKLSVRTSTSQNLSPKNPANFWRSVQDVHQLQYVKLRADTICAPIMGHDVDYKCKNLFKRFQKLARNSDAAQPCMKLHGISCFHTWQITPGMPTCAGDIMEKKGRIQILKGQMSLQQCLNLLENDPGKSKL